MIAVYFYHKTTRVPGTGLNPRVSALNVDSNQIVVNNETMKESALAGWYLHGYSLNENTNYAFTFDPQDTNYIYAVSQAYVPGRGGGGGVSVNYDAINAHTSRVVGALNIPDYTEKLNEIDSHIDIAKGEINDKIESIEIPETDISSITTGIGTLKGQFTKLSEWIKRKDDKEKSEELTEKEGEYSQILEDIESEFKTLLSSKDQEIEALKKELEEEKTKEDKYEAMVQVLEEEIQETKEKVEKETKDNILKTLETL